MCLVSVAGGVGRGEGEKREEKKKKRDRDSMGSGKEVLLPNPLETGQFIKNIYRHGSFICSVSISNINSTNMTAVGQ